jgi:hypothetical protein
MFGIYFLKKGLNFLLIAGTTIFGAFAGQKLGTKDFMWDGRKIVNEILDYLLLIGVIGVASVWVTAVFCFIVMTLGGYDD